MDEMVFDPNDLTLGELCDLADVAGEDVVKRLGSGEVSPKALVGLVWVMRRRSDPSFTLDDARQVKVTAAFTVDPDA